MSTYPMDFTIMCNGEAIASVTANIPLHVDTSTHDDDVSINYQAIQQRIDDAVQAFDKALEAS